MLRIAYRHILPVAQLSVYVLLVWYGCSYRPTSQHMFENWITPRPPFPTAWYPAWIDGPPSFEEQVARGINTPPVFVSMLILIPFDSVFPDGASRELASHFLEALFIPVLWYAIGRRLDRRMAGPMSASVARKALTWAGLTTACLVTLLITFTFARSLGELFVGRLLILAWGVIGTWICLKMIHRWKMKPVAG
jgi:small-conductance mechanosensitive channel